MVKLQGKQLDYAITLCGSLAILFFGYDQGLMGGVNTSPDYAERMGIGYTVYEPGNGYSPVITNTTRQGGIVAIYYLGTLVGALFGGLISDRYGRIKSMLVGAAWVVLGAALQTSAQNIEWMLCSRVINGIGTGILNAIVPVWSAEVAPYHSRGELVAKEFFGNILGVVIAYWLEFGLSFIDEGRSQFRWRFPIAFQIILNGLFIVTIILVPESPRWLVRAGRIDEAREILARLRSNGDIHDEKVTLELQDIVEVDKEERQHTKLNNYWNMFWGIGSGDLHLGRRIQLAFWLQILQEWVGIAAVTMWAPTIFGAAGYGARKAQWLSGLNNVTYMFSTLIAVYTIDSLGRRVGLFWGSVVQGIAWMLAFAFGLKIKRDPSSSKAYGAASTFSIFLYTATFGATWLTIPWVYPTEIFPLMVRAKGAALGGVCGWSIGNGWATLLFPVMFSHISEYTLLIFGLVNFATIPIVYLFYPETANRTLEEIDMLFASKSPFVWDSEREFKNRKAEKGVLSEGGPRVSEGLDKGEQEEDDYAVDRKSKDFKHIA